MPPDDEPDRGQTVERAVLAQHRRLDSLFEDALFSLRGGRPTHELQSGLQELREALETHFDQEDRLYYPTIWALRPDLKARLESLAGSHGAMLAHLDALRPLLDAGNVVEARSSFESLASDFRRHEEAEEAILATLDREIGARR